MAQINEDGWFSGEVVAAYVRETRKGKFSVHYTVKREGDGATTEGDMWFSGKELPRTLDTLDAMGVARADIPSVGRKLPGAECRFKTELSDDEHHEYGYRACFLFPPDPGKLTEEEAKAKLKDIIGGAPAVGTPIDGTPPESEPTADEDEGDNLPF